MASPRELHQKITKAELPLVDEEYRKGGCTDLSEKSENPFHKGLQREVAVP